jgi:uncharacterized repeat protein (TIGR03943 family)
MTFPSKFPTLKRKLFLPGLDILALLGWGALLLNYWRSGQLKLLIHPNYFGLVFATGTFLLSLAGLRAWQLVKTLGRKSRDTQRESIQHITLLPAGIGSGLLLITATVGFLIPPTLLNSQVALQRGVSESLPITREEPQAFHASIKPEQRTLIDWIRTLNVYPEPDAYAGQKARVTGFVVDLPQLPADYFLLTRFVLTCCAVDAYPVGLPVKIKSPADKYPPDTWLEVEGEMTTETLKLNSQTLQAMDTEKRQLVIAAQSITEVPPPSDPYGY